MFTTQRSPLCDGDAIATVEVQDPIEDLAAALADLEAMAWLYDLRMVAMLIGAARIELRESGQIATKSWALPASLAGETAMSAQCEPCGD